jgi:DNA helicase II / ATP-dependent DNA helicase PcrA
VDHREGLNVEQKEAVVTTDGPLLVLAGAGAGKTRVIAHRILEIVRRGTEPERILAITFTNKAAAEMRERVAALLPEERRLPFVSTFHSLGLQIIKENTAAMGFKRRPNIYDRNDSLRQMKQSLKDVGAEDIEGAAALSVLSRHKGEGKSISDLTDDSSTAANPRESQMLLAWSNYERALIKEGAVDFDDLLLRPMRFLSGKLGDGRAGLEARKRYQERWKYLHIDEYQDTNHVQAKLAELLVGPEQNICAVGDIDQTIYGWRGAVIENILHFERKYPKAKTIMLEQNYRSTQRILAAANEIIKKNPNRPDKNLFTKNAEGEAISLYQAFDEIDEAGFVARKVKELREKGLRPRDMAVLYRANFQSRVIEEALIAADIPYQVLGTRFFDRKEVKDALAFVRAALFENPADLGRVIDTLPGLGKITKLKVLSGGEGELTGKTRERVFGMRKILHNVQTQAGVLPPSQLVRFVLEESGLEALLKKDKVEGTERLENLRELVSLAARYDEEPIPTGMEGFLENIALMSEQDNLKEERDAVRLMTVHAAKGLEFPFVFIVGLEEGLFPYARQDESTSDKEEERRLMYVALTRAERKIYLSFASYRTIFGSKNATEPSQFLGDLPNEGLELEAPERLGRTIYLD